MAGSKRIAIIGAGACGLLAIKSCKEEGHVPVCYERTGALGGLWRYHDENLEGVASVTRTTVINTSKEMSAFSDFPPPAHFPNYMHNSKMFEYFTLYAEKFNLLNHIRYHFEVIKVEPTSDFDKTGRWIVSIRSTETAAVTQEEFDGVMVCIGHHVYPKIPIFPGQEKFQGTITHTHSLKNYEQYLGQNVVVVGIGNSGADAAVDSTYFAEQVYLSTRRGSWIVGRMGPNGIPFDFGTVRRRFLQLKLRSFDSICTELENQLNAKFDHAAYGLRPKHRVLSAHFTMNDFLPSCILNGRVIVKGDIERFVENGIIFTGDKGKVTPVNAVILATGYHIKFPFLDSKILSTEANSVHLYKYAILPQLKHHTLAIIGAVQPSGGIFPVAELQCRWFCRIMCGKLQLPSIQEMEADIMKKREANRKRYVPSTRHTIQVDFVPFMDELASAIGVKPNFFKMVFTDPKLFWACMNSPCFPYQYRLQGPHAWQGARDAILNYKERLYGPLNPEYQRMYSHQQKRFITSQKLMFLLFVSTLSMLYGRKYLDNLKPIEFLYF